uniref:Uncharacterized protein n=1 Tax=Rhizophora mucronata TaxID=61149 RepID=A0A2P2MMC2_RHIMU
MLFKPISHSTWVKSHL